MTGTRVAELRREFRERGFVRRRGFFSPDEAATLIDDIRRTEGELVREGALDFHSNLFRRSERLRELVSDQRVIDLVEPFTGSDVWVRFDQAVSKHPGGAEFPWHQDSAYSGVLDQHVQLWIALSPMTPENGGLWIEPGGHRRGLAPHRREGDRLVYQGEIEAPLFIDAQPGDTVIYSSWLPHYTAPNRTESERWAYVAEFASVDILDPYLEPPYFVVAREGRSAPQWVQSYRGRLSPSNHLRYLLPRLKRNAAWLRGRAASLLGRARSARRTVPAPRSAPDSPPVETSEDAESPPDGTTGR